MNELESEVMVGQLKRRGLKRVLDEELADLLVFNTCSIRDNCVQNLTKGV